MRTGELFVLLENDTDSVPNQLIHSIEQHASWSAKFRSDVIFLAPYLITVSTAARKLSLTCGRSNPHSQVPFL